jgi:hypothetical protein
MSNYTIVSAFISHANLRKDRSTEDYINFGKELLQLPHYKIVFIENDYVELVKSISGPNTTIIPFEKNELEFWDEITKIDLKLPAFRNQEKDTKEYMHLMTNKSYFCQKAIEINPYQTEKFVWLDFGITHILKNEFLLANLLKDNYEFELEKIRIGGIWDSETANKINNFKQINWFFAGGVFGGYSKDLLKFQELVKNEFKHNLSQKIIVWEVNLWYQIYQKRPEFFDVYVSNHDKSLIKNLTIY